MKDNLRLRQHSLNFNPIQNHIYHKLGNAFAVLALTSSLMAIEANGQNTLFSRPQVNHGAHRIGESGGFAGISMQQYFSDQIEYVDDRLIGVHYMMGTRYPIDLGFSILQSEYDQSAALQGLIQINLYEDFNHPSLALRASYIQSLSYAQRLYAASFAELLITQDINRFISFSASIGYSDAALMQPEEPSSSFYLAPAYSAVLMNRWQFVRSMALRFKPGLDLLFFGVEWTQSFQYQEQGVAMSLSYGTP